MNSNESLHPTSAPRRRVTFALGNDYMKKIFRFIGFIAFAFMSFGSFISPFFPQYRTVEIAPGLFAESWSPVNIWIDIGLGMVFALISVFCVWGLFKNSKQSTA